MRNDIEIPQEVIGQACDIIENTKSAFTITGKRRAFQHIARWMREECAKVADLHKRVCGNDPQDPCPEAIAEEIRSIGSTQ